MLVFYFSDDRILAALKNRTASKQTSHSALVVNQYGNTRRELSKIAEVVAWSILTGTHYITVFDQSGLLQEDKQTLGKFIQ